MTAANPNEFFDREYEQIRGTRFRLTTYPSLVLGSVHPSGRKHLIDSAQFVATMK